MIDCIINFVCSHVSLPLKKKKEKIGNSLKFPFKPKIVISRIISQDITPPPLLPLTVIAMVPAVTVLNLVTSACANTQTHTLSLPLLAVYNIIIQNEI